MKINRLKLNVGKTELIIFGSKFSLTKISVTSVLLGGTSITVSNVVRNLGVYLDSQLTFKEHCSRLTSGCLYQVRQLWQIRLALLRRLVKR